LLPKIRRRALELETNDGLDIIVMAATDVFPTCLLLPFTAGTLRKTLQMSVSVRIALFSTPRRKTSMFEAREISISAAAALVMRRGATSHNPAT